MNQPPENEEIALCLFGGMDLRYDHANMIETSRGRDDTTVSEVLRDVETYNRVFGGQSSGLVQLILSAIYIISPIDIIPEGFLGIIGLLDDLLIALICFLHVAALYRSVLYFRHGGSGP